MEQFLTYIKTKNAEIQAEMDANPGIWMSMLVEDEEFWIERGITTIQEYERDADETCLYEICKDLGWRRSDIKSLSDEELAKEIKNCGEMLSRQIDAEREGQRINTEKFEARIKDTIELGAGDRETAIKWIADAEGFDTEELQFCGWGSLEYRLNIPFDYIKRSLSND